MTRYVCSKMFTDMNIKFPYNSIKNCCKSNDYTISDSELQQLEQNGENIFTQNAEYMRRKRSMLMDNNLPENGCDTCIHTEPNSLFRDWNRWEKFDNSLDLEIIANADNFTTYEFVISSACDLKCVYCSEQDSTSWARELGLPINRGQEEWKQKVLRDLREHLSVKVYDSNIDYWFFFSGGEPTYNTETLSLIHEIISKVPIPNIVISTNANTKQAIMDRYIATIRDYPNVQWTFDCSIDGIGPHADAIRTGLNWQVFNRNIKLIMMEPNAKVRISPTVSMYSVPRMYEFVNYFYSMFAECNQHHSLMFNFNMVQEPELSPWSMPQGYASTLDASIQFCKEKDLYFHKHLLNVQSLIGTKIDEKTAGCVERKWIYFNQRRPQYEWSQLFPHVPEIIRELKNENIN